MEWLWEGYKDPPGRPPLFLLFITSDIYVSDNQLQHFRNHIIRNLLINMKASFVLTALAGIAGSVSAAAIAAPSNQYPPGVQVTVVDPAYIPAEFKTGAVVTRRDDGQQLQKRADHGVYFCTDANFSGYCVHIVAPANVNGKPHRYHTLKLREKF